MKPNRSMSAVTGAPARPRLARFIAAAFLAIAPAAMAGTIQSVGAMAFADMDTLIVADWRAGRIHSLRLPAMRAAAGVAFNLKNISTPIARALHVRPEQLRFEGMAIRPGLELAYVSVSVERGNGVPSPALVTVDAKGRVSVVNLGKLAHGSAAIRDRPGADQRFWNDTAAVSYTVTDLVYHQGKVYVAGLSSAAFASTLRIFDFPFTGKSSTTSVEMYHAVHDQMESRAPIRKMAIATLNGEPSLIAAYTCTPLVTIALKDLKDGAHVIGKTIAELGWGSAPVDMVSFDAGEGPMVLLTNSHKSADLMSVASIEAAAALPGLKTPVKWPTEPYLGLKAIPIPISGIAKLTDQDKEFLAALRRDERSGAMQLVSIRKGAFLRVSDFVNEYDFPGFNYRASDPFKAVHHTLRTDEGYPELAKRAAP